MEQDLGMKKRCKTCKKRIPYKYIRCVLCHSLTFNLTLDTIKSMDTRDAGRIGGKKLVSLKGREYFIELSRKAVAARKKKAQEREDLKKELFPEKK